MSEVAMWTPPPPETELATPPPASPPAPAETVFDDPLTGEKHTLPSGGWVQLRDVKVLRNKHQREVLRVAGRAEAAAEVRQNVDIERGWAVNRQLLIFLVQDWSLPYERDPLNPSAMWMLPSADPSVIEDLRQEDYNAFLRILEPISTILFPAAPNPDDYDNPASPTEPANG